ncbi:MAG TPA: ATP-dependent Clp protease ATP-binding subunit [Candidatus Absconditabacterales bacterium]|nr:ATP-dependent Clp protease ATP-binding subunit [Candidatus Absconditabacterales bacterium]HMT26775.1 ATP-dependent Clp protease ATP-binding subunit [Candidatus Absconditabacterales bacterium]
MNKKTIITQDYKDTIIFANQIAVTLGKKSLSAEILLLASYLFTQQYEGFHIFRKMLGITKNEIIDTYIKKNINFPENYKEKTKEKPLQKKLENEVSPEKRDFFYIINRSVEHLSGDLKKHLIANNIDVNSLQTKSRILTTNQAIKQMGIVAFISLISKLIKAMNLDPNSISMAHFEPKEHIDQLLNSLDHDIADKGDENNENTSNVTTSQNNKDEKKLTIEYFGTDLTKETKDGVIDPVIGRDKEIEQVIFTLLRKTKNNPLLIGEAGVGKTAIVEGLAKKILLGEVPEKLKNKKIFMLDMGSLVAGTKYRGEFEARLKSILEEAADITNNIILFIDELHTIVGSGNSEGSSDAANMLKPLLARGKIKLIGATTFDEYQKYIEKDAALKRRFQEITVNEPSTNDTISILKGLRQNFEDHHGVSISDESIENAVTLSKRYILNKQLPDKAIDIIDEAAARKSTINEKLENDEDYQKYEADLEVIHVKLEKAIEKQDYFGAAELKEEEENIKKLMKTVRNKKNLPAHLRPEINKNDIGIVLADKIGIPATMVTETEIARLKRLESDLSHKIHGQKEAVDAVVKSIKRNRLSIISRNKPIASFLFLGPSGVGKTYLAKTIAKEYFGDEKALIRVDMSEFMEKYSVSKLIGSAPGYVGYEEGGILTESVRRKPYSVVLFDEIEKASKDVLNILLQILDEGHLKDSKGRRVDFKSTILILTSNLGSEEFAKKISKIGFETHDKSTSDQKSFETTKTKVMEHVKNFMSPELLNRLDHNIIFKPLSKEVLNEIFQQKLSEFEKARKIKEEIKIPNFSAKKREEIIDKIYDPQFGARPIERYIYDEVEPKIIEQIMKNSD